LNSKTALSIEIPLYESWIPKCLYFSIPKEHGLEIKIKEKLEKDREKKVKRFKL
jgi:hypothetical protein